MLMKLVKVCNCCKLLLWSNDANRCTDPQGWTDWTWPDSLQPPTIERPEGKSKGADTKDTIDVD